MYNNNNNNIIQVKLLECYRCGHKWYPRLKHLESEQSPRKFSKPKLCPKCKNRRYDIK